LRNHSALWRMIFCAIWIFLLTYLLTDWWLCTFAGRETGVGRADAEGRTRSRVAATGFSGWGMPRCSRRPVVAHRRDETARIQCSVVETLSPLQQRLPTESARYASVISADSCRSRPAKGSFSILLGLAYHPDLVGWLHVTAVERRSSAGELSLSCSRPALQPARRCHINFTREKSLPPSAIRPLVKIIWPLFIQKYDLKNKCDTYAWSKWSSLPTSP